jgi:hypothetical protein
VGRRSRKRAAAELGTRAERDEARRARRAAAAAAGRDRPKPGRRPGRPTTEERPPAPWGSFPLSELVVLLGIGLMLWGLFSWKASGNLKFGAGLAIAGLGGLELSLREHLAGYRSHSSLLAGVAAFAVVSLLALGPGPHVLGALLAIGVGVFAAAFLGLRGLFRRRSGGLSFR